MGLLALVMFASACDGGSSTRSRGSDHRVGGVEAGTAGGVDSVRENRTSSPPPSPRQLDAADFVLTPGPETQGFTEDAPQSGTDDNSAASAPSSIFSGEVATCAGATSAQIGPESIDDAEGPVFTHQDTGGDLRSFASVHAETSTVAGHREIVRLDRFPGCYGRGLVDEIDSDELGATLLGTEFAPPPPGATDRITVTIDVVTADQQNFRMYVDLIMIFTGRVEATIATVTPFDPADPALLATVTSQVERKVAAQ